MAEKRNVRANESRSNIREDEARPQAAWSPPSLLDAPEARSGMTQRWVATSIQGKDTPDNVFKRMREGWNPRPADTVKDKRFPTINHGQWEGCIGIEGMLLCEMPIEQHKSMKDYYNNRNWEQNESLSGDLDALNRQGGPRVFQTRESSVSKGRKDLAAMDD